MTTSPLTNPEADGGTRPWDIVAGFLSDARVSTVFGLPGDDLTALSALDRAGVHFVDCRDQRAAVFMAVGYALRSGRPGVAVVGRGPAVSNCVTGLLEASAAAAPLVLLTGGVPATLRGSGAFQEADHPSLVRHVVKWAARVEHPHRLVPSLVRAFTVASAGPPGPVCLEIPDGLAPLPTSAGRRPPPRPVHQPAPGTDAVQSVAQALAGAERPLFLIGGGMRHAGARDAVADLADRVDALLLTTASGRGAVAEDSRLYCGLSGLYAVPGVRALLHDVDFVLALGTRLEETATEGWEEWAPQVPVAQVNLAAVDFHPDYDGHRVQADAGRFVSSLLRALTTPPDTRRRGAWRERVEDVHAGLWSERGVRLRRQSAGSGLTVAALLAALRDVVPDDAVLVQENGLQDMWSYFYPYWSCGAAGGSVVPSEQTPLGSGAAAALGVKAAAPDRCVVCLTGDGAFDSMRNELVTAARENLGVLFVVLDNGGYGWLQAQYDSRPSRPSPTAPATGPQRFTTGLAPRGALALPADAHHAVLQDPAAAKEVLSAALRACATGRCAVVEVPVSLTDLHPHAAGWFHARRPSDVETDAGSPA